jgi:hypothetical protein
LQPETVDAGSSQISSPSSPTLARELNDASMDLGDDDGADASDIIDATTDVDIEHHSSRPRRKKAEVHKPIVVDIIDTPAIRREKSRRKREERARIKALELAQESKDLQRSDEVGSSGVGIADLDGVASLSELSELSDLSDDAENVQEPDTDTDNADHQVDGDTTESDGEEEVSEHESQEENKLESVEIEKAEPVQEVSDRADVSVAPLRTGRGRGRRKANELPLAPPQPGDVVLREGESLEPGTLVWAKIGEPFALWLFLIPHCIRGTDSYPWWAAVVWQVPDPGVPLSVVARFKKAQGIQRRKGGPPLTLVQFYDKGRTWYVDAFVESYVSF